MRIESGGIECGNANDPALFRQDAVPEALDTSADAGDWANAGDDCASPAHAITLFALASTYALIERNVLLAML